MGIVEKSLESQLANIQERTGRTLDELFARLEAAEPRGFEELRDLLMEETGMERGDAETVAFAHRQRGTDAPKTVNGELARIYSGDREELRRVHDALMERIGDLGDFEVSPREGYVGLRRKKQFATVGPAGVKELEITMEFDHADPPERHRPSEEDGSGRHSVRISDVDEVDEELIAWMREAYERAG